MHHGGQKPPGYQWRSSKLFILTCVTIALFSENFLYSFIIPILQFILEDRLQLDPAKTQTTTSALLSTHAFVCFISGPFIGSLADKISSRKVPLLLSLGGEILGTIIIAAAPSLPVLFLGRVIQGIFGNAVWIVGFATIADTVGSENRARVISAISAFFISGLLVGPMVSGTLIDLIGYWPTWLTAIAILVADMIMRLIMIESPMKGVEDVEDSVPEIITPDETSCLIPSSANDDREQGYHTKRDESLLSCPSQSPAQNFYKVVLSHPRALTAMACHATNGLSLVAIDTTLPLHVTRVFGWDTSRVSLMFLLLQLPTLFLSPLTGWMKDRMGTKVPSGAGLLATALLLWLLGTSGPDGLSSIGSGERGQAVYMASMLGLGLARTLITGCGVMEMTGVMIELQETQPAIFGPNGGFSRAYSLTNMSWTFSMFIGPILAGSLTQTVGYYYMNVTLALLYFQKK
ncbi:major facilitator superfamily domain-containing protein [Penicillium coprophilum]|uniref:major facilitator superfamily domain-containing protein n=1 Tax=Penicillium coprophilum TaxID=36646 RepID=UPI00239D673B|nr:major facilitator superfamily domain-containing protein [Penicillium coprophilum]KAJ5178342.1 major facilitator superfamily domain-containing protein [Penicillium coprophilum]